jgi:hypothetical protein
MPRATRQAAESTTIEVPMHYKKTTSGTYCFEADEDDAAVTTQYVRKSAFNGATVNDETTITVTITIPA